MNKFIAYIKSLWSDSSNDSITRVLTTVCYVTANIIALCSTISGREYIGTITALLSTATILKVGQKYMEK